MHAKTEYISPGRRRISVSFPAEPHDDGVVFTYNNNRGPGCVSIRDLLGFKINPSIC
jgi:hypothetical protein